jgi:hypothetical protein
METPNQNQHRTADKSGLVTDTQIALKQKYNGYFVILVACLYQVAFTAMMTNALIVLGAKELRR